MSGLQANALRLALLLSLGVALPALGQSAARHDTVGEQTSDSEVIRPRYLLMSPAGRAVTSEDFPGRLQLVAFGFTSCPDVCPTTLLEMTHVLTALGDKARHLQPIFITVDPQRDTALVLGAYTRAFDPRILGLTGAPDLVRRAADSFHVRYAKVQEPGAGPDVYTMDHSAGMFLLAPDGSLVAKFGYGATVSEVLERISYWLLVVGK